LWHTPWFAHHGYPCGYPLTSSPEFASGLNNRACVTVLSSVGSVASRTVLMKRSPDDVPSLDAPQAELLVPPPQGKKWKRGVFPHIIGGPPFDISDPPDFPPINPMNLQQAAEPDLNDQFEEVFGEPVIAVHESDSDSNATTIRSEFVVDLNADSFSGDSHEDDAPLPIEKTEFMTPLNMYGWGIEQEFLSTEGRLECMMLCTCVGWWWWWWWGEGSRVRVCVCWSG
jgi:hypothetical protein